MFAEIITIGDEILIGQIVDTNSAWLGKKLNDIGIEILQVRSVRDRREEIAEALQSVKAETRLVLMTGGLGPTRDDITKITLASFFGVEMVHNPEVEKHIEDLFAKIGREVNALNRSQAMLPANCEALTNDKGTAPGMFFKWGDKWLVSMPGVPYEMKYIMEKHIVPRLQARLNELGVIRHRTLLTQGVPESILAERLTEFEDQLPEFIKMAYLPSAGQVRLRLTARGEDEAMIEEHLEKHFQVLKGGLKSISFGEGDDKIEEVIGRLLKKRAQTVGFAESCTGGYISHLITSVPGSSAYFHGSLLTYANMLKRNLLDVDEDSIKQHGAVSEEVVLQMAANARKKLQTDYALATSGIAGPDGGYAEKPVGLVWIGYSGPDGTQAYKFQFNGDRERIIRKAAITVLDILRRKLEGTDQGGVNV